MKNKKIILFVGLFIVIAIFYYLFFRPQNLMYQFDPYNGFLQFFNFTLLGYFAYKQTEIAEKQNSISIDLQRSAEISYEKEIKQIDVNTDPSIKIYTLVGGGTPQAIPNHKDLYRNSVSYLKESTNRFAEKVTLYLYNNNESCWKMESIFKGPGKFNGAPSTTEPGFIINMIPGENQIFQPDIMYGLLVYKNHLSNMYHVDGSYVNANEKEDINKWNYEKQFTGLKSDIESILVKNGSKNTLNDITSFINRWSLKRS